MTTQKELNRIKKHFKYLNDIQWIESMGIGFQMKTQTLTATKITMSEEIGYKFHNARSYSLDQDYVIATFARKEPS